ncbi:MAG TPA: ribokinase [Candidatus Limnocylindria bacterium]|nr:ribokinase [Candidatus Limnocylindria bacterium]
MAATAGTVCVVGSINVDLVVVAERLPRPGETVLGGRFETHDGGKGANQAVAAARAGASVAFIGAVGTDANGDRALDALVAEGVDVSRVRRHATDPTGVALIAVGPRGENQIVVAPGVNASLELADADLDTIATADVLLTNHEVPPAVVRAALDAARRHERLSILNPAPARALPADVLRLGPILTPNEHELVVGIGRDTAEAALDELVARHAGPVVVTQGPAGALLARGDERTRFDGFVAPSVVDTTGAGDAFNGVLAAWLAFGASLEDAIVAANAAGALSVAAAGARGGLPSRAEIEELVGLR